MLDEDDVGTHPYLAKLGPDALDTAVHWRDVLVQLRDKRFNGRSLAALYLDQAFVAGIGNYLRSEILFVARLHPLLRPRDCTSGELGRLARATLDITRQAYETAGVTNKPGRVARLKKAGATRRDYRFAVFARTGKPCYVCEGRILREALTSRRIYTCPNCQPHPRERALS